MYYLCTGILTVKSYPTRVKRQIPHFDLPFTKFFLFAPAIVHISQRAMELFVICNNSSSKFAFFPFFFFFFFFTLTCFAQVPICKHTVSS
jgi:hypothetical protein